MNPQEKLTPSFKTLGEWLDFAHQQFENSELFYGHGADSPWDEAVFLVLRALDLPPDSGEEVLQLAVSEKQQQRLAELIDQRVSQKIPVAYLLNEAWFAGYPYYVDERVLIPRSPIAELIEHQFRPWVQNPPGRILDLCTGSGCIAIACAQVFPEAQVVGTDLSLDALAVAKINTLRHEVNDRVQLIESDLFDQVEGTFDLIVSNPPYVGPQEIAGLPEEYRHEPELGLAGGDQDGLALVAKMLEKAGQHLTDHGILVVEVGNSDEALAQRYPNLPFVWLEFERGGHGVFVLERNQLF